MNHTDVKKHLNRHISLDECQKHIAKHPIFCFLTTESILQLAILMEEIHVQPNEVIVREGDYFDGFYLIVSGNATVSKELKRIQKTNSKNISILGPENAIDLGEAGFSNQHGIRATTVTALSSMILLKMDLFNFYNFLKEHGTVYPSLKNMSEKFLLMHLIRQIQLIHASTIHKTKEWAAIISPSFRKVVASELN
jgi:CRP-like cAMP-binding protein